MLYIYFFLIFKIILVTDLQLEILSIKNSSSDHLLTDYTVEIKETICISWSALSTRNEDVPSDLRLLHGEELLEVLLDAGLPDGGELKFILPTA